NFVPGPNLAGTLKALPRAPDEAWLRAMLTPVLDAVDLLHAAQVHHGGISAEAIVVRGVGVPVLLGSAPPPSDEKPLAPPGAWMDLRALASLLHAAVTGQAALGAAVPRVHRPLTGLPYDPRFLSGIDRALSVDPRQRLRSVAEFRRCLGWAPPATAGAPAAAPGQAPAPARAAAPVLSAAAERALAPPNHPPAARANGRAEPGFGDTLQALKGHRKLHPLACPGSADLTVHADFPAVLAAARAEGASTAIAAQGDFLLALGIEARAAALARANPARAEQIGRQLQRLVAPGEMGQLFKAAAIAQPGAALPGFGT
ncbi:MAG: SAM-dependent methyltransferase, partial [Phenylobacterium sp.]